MVIELRGVEFHNKGAELMLLAILDKVRKTYPEVVLVMETRNTVGPEDKRRVGIKTKFQFRKKGIDFSCLGWLIPKTVRTRKGMILEKEIDVVLDGSGFAFGDIWGADKAKSRLSDHIVKWKKEGKKVIVLPQAFGSFNDVDLQKEMRKLIAYADLIFARDTYSYNYLTELTSHNTNVFRKPDFTNLLEGITPAYFKNRKKHIGIIPNYKMIETNVFNSESEYISLLVQLVSHIRGNNYTPYFLNHEGNKDLGLIHKTNASLESKVEVIDESNALFIKGIINESSGVITSRFHGLVSALSQSTPCLCIGWSHKYNALLEEYNYMEGLITMDDLVNGNLNSKINLITERESRIKIIDTLNKSALTQKNQSEKMWEMVFDTIVDEVRINNE